MPLRNHFRPPVSMRASWEAFYVMWRMAIVQQFRTTLPLGFTAGPRVHADAFSETDDVPETPWIVGDGSVAVEVEPEEEYEYAVHVYDAERDQTLVAAVEIVSPANKDRPEKRNSFVAKCAALLKAGVSVCVVDLVTVRHFNLYTELMAFIGQGAADPMSAAPPATYAAACRWGPRGGQDAARNVVARHARRPAAADRAAVAPPRPRRPARPGQELRAGLPRPVDHLTPHSLSPLPRGRVTILLNTPARPLPVAPAGSSRVLRGRTPAAR